MPGPRRHVGAMHTHNELEYQLKRAGQGQLPCSKTFGVSWKRNRTRCSSPKVNPATRTRPTAAPLADGRGPCRIGSAHFLGGPGADGSGDAVAVAVDHLTLQRHRYEEQVTWCVVLPGLGAPLWPGDEGFAQFVTHPDHLAALATLFDMSSPDVATCRVLEVGCARGDNLIPMAGSLPLAQFAGIDLSGRQIDEGRATIAALGLTNVELREMSIMDVTADFGSFDYIVIQEHGDRSVTRTRSIVRGFRARLAHPRPVLRFRHGPVFPAIRALPRSDAFFAHAIRAGAHVVAHHRKRAAWDSRTCTSTRWCAYRVRRPVQHPPEPTEPWR